VARSPRSGRAVEEIPGRSASGLPERRDAVDPADEQHALLVEARVPQGVGRGLARVQVDWLTEAVAVMKQAWSGRPFSHDGRFYRAKDYVLSPPR
jgi:hypothetical protein